MEGHNHAAMGGGEGDQLNPVRLTEGEARTIGVTFATVERKPLDRRVRTVGTVEYDETRLANLNPKIEGWVERLYVDFTGAPVRQGQPLMEVYSPKLVTAQEELILARRLADEAGGERAQRNAQDLLESARRRLAYWDIPEAEIERIEAADAPSKTLTLRAPASGIVVEKNVVEGGRIMPGMDVFEIADLSTVWVEGEVFEKDLSLATEGQAVEVTFQAYPGEVFEGVITYVYPTVDVESRTGRVRVELENPGLRLRPGMYANIDLEVEGHHQGLAVPRTAVLHTGERAVVFVRHADGRLVPHEVTTGLVAGTEIEILDGLQEGQRVVSSASFLIDAESNLGASMADMEAMEGGESMEGMDHSGADMGTMDTGSESMDEMDHSGNDMEGGDMQDDAGAMDHSGHE
ncbi:MAG: efflux RND transporter periplasmic adaptor subunit [Gammaproteobacteria bacterium]|nr:efflux RND transporter periplasmic adaptor subunit [Gemmatimonadota bacterium]NIU78766.1 efflux RND transporter periplasmic adaptor subunit [Gammaproteobacteria bacterium]NIY11942.1 efflux RND transporter periplasmic adaptor subunit [Gemmatimonadota bacterium]